MYSMKSVIAQKGIYNVIKYHLVQQLPQMSYPGDYLYSVLHFRKSGLPQVTQSKQITDLDATLFFITTPLCLQNIPIRRWISCLKGITYSSLQTEMHACQGSSVVSDSLRRYGLWPASLFCPWGFSRQEYWRGLPHPLPEDLPNSGKEPRSPALQADSLPSEPPGKPSNTGESSLTLLQAIFPTQELSQGLLHCRQILYQLSYQGSPNNTQ